MSESLAGRLSRLGSSGYIKVGPLLWAGSLTTASGAWSPATSEDESGSDEPPPSEKGRLNPPPSGR